MTASPFADYHYPSQPPRPAPENLSDEQLTDSAYKERALAMLLRRGVLSHTFGQHGEYEVRTTQTVHQPWQHRCYVLHRGKAIKRAFAPITIDHRREVRNVPHDRAVNEAMRLKWATEAVDVHLTRCSVLQEYLLLAAVNLQMPSKSRRYHLLLIILGGVTFLVAYGVWKQGVWTDKAGPSGEAPVATREVQENVGASGNASVAMREVRDPAADRQPTGQPLDATPPLFSGVIRDETPAEPVQAAQTTPQTQPPKTVHLGDLLQNASLQWNDRAPRAPTVRDPSGAGTSDVQEGDLLHLTGWVSRISRDPERAYRLHVRSSRERGNPDLIAVVPHPDRASESPAMRAQLQTVRSFITQRLLRQQEPSPRGSVMRRPVSLQLTGPLIAVDIPPGKNSRDLTPRWEVHPVLEIQFASQPESAGRSRPE